MRVPLVPGASSTGVIERIIRRIAKIRTIASRGLQGRSLGGRSWNSWVEKFSSVW